MNISGSGAILRSRKGFTLSVASRSPEGQSEAEIKKVEQLDSVPGRQYCVRRRKVLSLEDQERIVEAYQMQYIPQREVDRRFRVTTQLVRDLVSETNNQPENYGIRKIR